MILDNRLLRETMRYTAQEAHRADRLTGDDKPRYSSRAYPSQAQQPRAWIKNPLKQRWNISRGSETYIASKDSMHFGKHL